jgi:flagellar basal body-associated protein FliL
MEHRMATGTTKVAWLCTGVIAVVILVSVLFFAVSAYLRSNRFEACKEDMEQQFLSSANQLRNKLQDKDLDHLCCRITSAKYGNKKMPLGPDQTVQARRILLNLLSRTRMQPSFLQVSKQHVAAMGYLAFFFTVQDAERNENRVVSIAYYEYPNAVRISAAKRLGVCDIDILLDQETHAEIHELIEGAFSQEEKAGER